jgi:hypothetical protein
MEDVAYFASLRFAPENDGVAPGDPVECLSLQTAILRAEYRSRREAALNATPHAYVIAHQTMKP